MIEPAEIVFAIGYIVGIFSMIIAGAVAAAINSNGKEPKYVKCTGKYDDGYWQCPDCGTGVGYYDLKDDYCPGCGTKIDWRKIKCAKEIAWKD